MWFNPLLPPAEQEDNFFNMKIFVFDFDGTFYKFNDAGNFKESGLRKGLVEKSMDYIKKNEKEELTEEEIKNIFIEALRSKGGIGKFLAQRYNLNKDDYFQKTWGALDPVKYLIVFPEVLETINKLSQEGNILIILTKSSINWVKKVLEVLKIPQSLFNEIYSAESFEDYPNKEPIFKNLIEKYANDTLYFVGNEEGDVSFPKSLGFNTLLMNDPREIKKLLI